jgi:DNA-binding NtrC family response regulator
MILERAGYQVVAIDDPDEAVRIFNTSAVDAVVFGDSINGEQRFQLARTFKSLNRSVPIVALSKASGSQIPAGHVDQQLESLGDPHLLLEALSRVLPQDGDGSAQSARVHDGNTSAKAASLPHGGGPSAKISDSKTPKNSDVQEKTKNYAGTYCAEKEKTQFP